MLAQIEIRAFNKNKGYVYKVKGVKIARVSSKATLNFDKALKDTDDPYFAWTETERDGVYEARYEETIILGDKVHSIMPEGNAMLIPQMLREWDGKPDATDNDGTYLAVLVNITTKDGAQVYPKTADGSEAYAWAAVGNGTTWWMGKHYIYDLDFSLGAGKTEPAPEDPNQPGGEDILGGPIQFTVNVSDWNDLGVTPDLFSKKNLGDGN